MRTVVVLLAAMLLQTLPTEQPPTKENPIRLSAFAVQMEAAAAGVVEVTIERWSTPAERQELVGLVETATNREGGQRHLLDALEHISPRVGFIQTPNSLGWDLKYAHEELLPDGSRQIVLVTDKPISGLAVMRDPSTVDYPFGLMELRFPPGNSKGEGKMLGQTAVCVTNGRLEIDNYGLEPTRLTEVTEHRRKD